MNINADFAQRASVHSTKMAWAASPMAGVSRRMLDRIGGEVARATSIVRYDPGSAFSPHTHTGGEEFLVLEGVFQDEHGDYPAGSYVRNPPTSRHTPGSAPGCTIFVKLWQFEPADRTQLKLDTSTLPAREAADRPGVERIDLFEDRREQVALEYWKPGTGVSMALAKGAEMLVLEGDFEEGGERFDQYSWLRLPCGARLKARAGANGVKLWLKTGHLPHALDTLPG